MATLLVTGGGGTLGRTLVAFAPARGWDVRATWLNAQPELTADWLQTDVRDPDAVARAVEGVDAVIHTAYRQSEDAWSTNVDGSETVARAAAGRRLIHLSSDVVFDGTIGHYSEEDVPAPVNDYGRSKAEAELRVADAHPARDDRPDVADLRGARRPAGATRTRRNALLHRRASLTRARRRPRAGPARPARARGSRAAAPGRRRRRQPLRLRASCSEPTRRRSNAHRRHPTVRPT